MLLAIVGWTYEAVLATIPGTFDYAATGGAPAPIWLPLLSALVAIRDANVHYLRFMMEKEQYVPWQEASFPGLDVRVDWWDKPFNYSAVNNRGARLASGEVMAVFDAAQEPRELLAIEGGLHEQLFEDEHGPDARVVDAESAHVWNGVRYERLPGPHRRKTSPDRYIDDAAKIIEAVKKVLYREGA